MLRYLLAAWQRRQLAAETCAEHCRDKSLQIALWVVWTLAVVLVAYISWRADHIARRPFDLLGLTIHCGLTGLIGFIVVTKIEMWLQPWRFLD